MAAFTIRRALPEDYKDLLEVFEGLYDGEDYLPFVFHPWLQDPNREVLVAHLGSKLVGFASATLIDGGATCYMSDIRIHPNYLRQGLGLRLSRSMLQHVRLNGAATVKRARYVIESPNSASLAMLAKEVGASKEVLYQRGQQYTLYLSVSKDAIRLDSLDLTAMESIRRCSKQELLGALIAGENKQWAQELFPEGLLMLEFTPFDVMIPSNWDGVFDDDCTHVLLDKKGDPIEDRGLKSISIGQCSQRVQGMFWVTTICSTDPESFKAHVGRQLQLACEHIHGKEFWLMLNCAEGFVRVAKSALNEAGIEGRISEYCYLILERDYQPLASL